MKWLAVVALSACGFPRATDQLACELDTDCTGGRVCEEGFCVVGDVQDDAAPPDTVRFDCQAWTPPQHFTPCGIPLPIGPLTLDAGIYTFNTGTGELTDPVGGISSPPNQTVQAGMVISVDSVLIATGSTLRVVGPVPLIVASWTDIQIIGDIDVGSTALALGAGANPTTECALHAATNGTAGGSGGGGAGGASFQGAGGNGGDGDGGAANGVGGVLVAAPPSLLGGCTGATGGAGDLLGGPGGSGGGAIQLTAQNGVTIAGKINAGGAGGAPGQTVTDGGGGGGGGSGGMIGLEGSSLTISDGAILAANGGGGGEGGDDTAGEAGTDGTATNVRAPGGSNNPAGNGGAGSGLGIVGVAGPLQGVIGQNDAGGGGGGGGGGGAGFITFKAPAAATVGAATISPPQTLIP